MPFCFCRPCIKRPPVIFRPIPIRKYPINSFSSTAFRAASVDESRQTHYETLKVPITATTQEIKKQFYALSLAHHPDTNPKDPKASAKFSSISSAYHVLSNTTKRARYDQENNIHQPIAPSGTHTSSSYKGSYVGSRPPSGLSKRRGAFRGPPPSFYAHGGYGANHQYNEREQQQQQQQQRQQRQREHEHEHGPSSEEGHASFIYRNTVPHFDASAHFRTQVHEDTRRRLRRSREFEEARIRAREEGVNVGGYDGGSTTTRFFVIAGMLLVAMVTANVGKSMSEPPPATSRAHATIRKNPVDPGASASKVGSREKEHN